MSHSHSTLEPPPFQQPGVMTANATITITSGPDRGKVFELEEEVVHLGQGANIHVELSDPLVSGQQASILNRNGRFAIYTPLDHTIEVDGSIIPAERWVWLPNVARVRLSDYTSFQFNSAPEHAEPSASSPPLPKKQSGGVEQLTAKPVAAPPEPQQPPPKKLSRREQRQQEKLEKLEAKKKKNQQLAQFITDASGDSLVKLGEDGHLPELHLAEGLRAKKPQGGKASSGTSQGTMYALVGFSMLCSLVMLFMDFEPGTSSGSMRVSARREIENFYARGGTPPKAYQEQLQEARFAAARNDRRSEIQAYRRVLDMLNAEDLNGYSGLTGNNSEYDDERLRELIGILISR